MAISYTTNFNFPLVDDGCENWMAVINGILEDMDIEIYKAQHPMVNLAGEVMVSIVGGMVIKKMYSTTGA